MIQSLVFFKEFQVCLQCPPLKRSTTQMHYMIAFVSDIVSTLVGSGILAARTYHDTQCPCHATQ